MNEQLGLQRKLASKAQVIFLTNPARIMED